MYGDFDGDINRYTWDIIERTIGDKKRRRLKEDDLASNLKDCLNVKTAIDTLKKDCEYYEYNLATGRKVLDDFKNNLEA